MPTLYDLDRDYLALEELLLEAGPELDAEAALAFDRLFADWTADSAEKAEGYYRIIRKLEMQASAAKAEAEQYAMMARVRTNAAARLKDRMKAHLEATGRKEIVTASGKKFVVQSNGGKLPLAVNDSLCDLDEINQDFVRVKKELDTEAVREHLESGCPLLWASLSPRGTSLRIR